MHEQNKALEIANKVDTSIVSYPPRYVHCDAAAAELRRQHQEIQELKKVKEELLDALFDALGLLRDDYPRTVEHMLELYTKHLNPYKD